MRGEDEGHVGEVVGKLTSPAMLSRRRRATALVVGALRGDYGCANIAKIVRPCMARARVLLLGQVVALAAGILPALMLSEAEAMGV